MARKRKYFTKEEKLQAKRLASSKYQKTKKGKLVRKNLVLKYKFGITLEEWNKMFQEQQGCCAICGKHQSEFKKTFDTDHDHITGKVRGLLCPKCNLGLAYFDNKDWYNKALKYLEK